MAHGLPAGLVVATRHKPWWYGTCIPWCVMSEPDELPTLERLLGDPRDLVADRLSRRVVATSRRARPRRDVPHVGASPAVSGRGMIPTLRVPTMQFSRLCADTLAHLAGLGKSPHTILNYGIGLRQFQAFLAEQGLTDDAKHFTDEAVMRWIPWLRGHGASSKTILARLTALGAVARYGARVKDGRQRPVVPMNPLVGLERPKAKKPPEKFLLPTELRAFMAVERPMRDHVARAVLLDVGLRRSEQCAVNFGHLLEVNGATLLQLVVKGGDAALVPLSPPVAQLLWEWRIQRNMPDPDEPVFVDQDGQRYRPPGLAALIQRIGRAAGIRRFVVTPHVIRHTLEVVRRRAGIDTTVRSKLLTHSSPASLISYQHTLPDELIGARMAQVAELERYIGGPLA